MITRHSRGSIELQSENDAGDQVSRKPARVYYIDWMKVIGIYGVVFVHSLHETQFTIQNHSPKSLDRRRALDRGLLQIGIPMFFYFSGKAYALSKAPLKQIYMRRCPKYALFCILGVFIFNPINLAMKTGDVSKLYTYEVGELFENIWFLIILLALTIINAPVFAWVRAKVGQPAAVPVEPTKSSRRRNARCLYASITLAAFFITYYVSGITGDFAWILRYSPLVVLYIAIFTTALVSPDMRVEVLLGVPIVSSLLYTMAMQHEIPFVSVLRPEVYVIIPFSNFFFVAGFLHETLKEHRVTTSIVNGSLGLWTPVLVMAAGLLLQASTDDNRIYQVEPPWGMIYCVGTWISVAIWSLVVYVCVDHKFNDRLYKHLASFELVSYMLNLLAITLNLMWIKPLDLGFDRSYWLVFASSTVLLIIAYVAFCWLRMVCTHLRQRTPKNTNEAMNAGFETVSADSTSIVGTETSLTTEQSSSSNSAAASVKNESVQGP